MTARTFAYFRVSTAGQDTSNQAGEIAKAGIAVQSSRVVHEVISGSIAAMQRPLFAKLVDRIEDGDLLAVTKLDRLGRNAIDVRQTIELLAGRGVRVKCLALGDTDLTSTAGKLVMQIIAAIAEFERDLLIERTKSGQDRARSEGKRFGRPPALGAADRLRVRELLATGQSVAVIARTMKTSRRTIDRVAVAAQEVVPVLKS